MNRNDPQYCIFKADDIREHDEVLSPGWCRFIDLIVEKDVTAALGLIGDSLADPSSQYVDRLKELAEAERFEFWNHGYDHHLRKRRDDGSEYSEFHNTSIEHQRDHLNRTQDLARDRLGMKLTTFGAPGNHIDDNTLTVIDESEISIWMYPDSRTKKHTLPRTINVEHPTHYPEYDAFTETYSDEHPVLTLQLHPSGWDDDRFAKFERIVDFLIDRDCVFTNPTPLLLEPAA